MSFESLQERLAALQESIAQLRELIDRLANVKFDGDAGNEDDSGELSLEISQVLRDGQEDLKALREEVGYVQAEEHDLERLKEGVEKLGKDLTRCRQSFRKARLSAKNNMIQAERLEHELLVKSFSAVSSDAGTPVSGTARNPFASATRAPRFTQQIQSSLSEEDQQTVGAANNYTNALRRTHDLIAAELSRSEYAHQTLTESSNALKQLNEQYGSLDTMLASSRDLLGTLLRSQKSDSWYLQTALYMLMVTAGWLVFRRILYGPLWWLVWLPFRLVFGTGTKVGSAVLQGVGAPAQSGQVEAGQQQQNVPIKGLPKEDLPTAQVGQGEATETAESVMDTIEKIVDAVNEADELGQIPKEGDLSNEGAGNTKKRTWEEPKTVVNEDTRPRDEL